MSTSKPPILGMVGLSVLAVAVTFIVLMIDAGIINGLPRSMQGESVSVPRFACVGLVLVTALLLPWLASLPFLREPRTRIYFFVFLALALAACYFLFEFDHLLSKAYSRGL